MTTWKEGDSDPTLGSRRSGGLSCYAVGTVGRFCTWPLDHTHPQHIAGGTHDVIIEVWPVTA